MNDSAGAAFRRFDTDGRLEHLPGLDGLRGLAVVAVVLFHGNWTWARGGFVGVSVFFTLSGFLITSLLIAEHRRHSTVSLRRFWTRRFGRLLPAAWLTIAATVIAAARLGQYGGEDRGDALASLFQVANWRFLLSGASYGDVFAAPSPFRHFWSLAIEEQVYVVLPVLIAAVLVRRNGSLRLLGSMLAALCAASIVTVLASDSVDRIYYGTDTRAAELLFGALAAVVVSSPAVRERLVGTAAMRGVLAVLGTAGAAAIAFAAATVEAGSSFVQAGGLVAIGVASTVVVVAVASGVGPLASLCAVAPLRWLGNISYGVYLFHWPLLVFVTERRTGLGHGPRFALVVVVTLAAAALSARLFEQPLRRTVTTGRRRVWAAMGTAVTLVAALAWAAPRSQADAPFAEPVDNAAARAAYEEAKAGTSEWGVLGEQTPVISAFGDSVAFSLTYQLATWSHATHDGLFLGGDVRLGCGIGRGGWEDGVKLQRRDPVCDAWPERWSEMTASEDLDIAVVHTGQWEIVDRKLAGEDRWRTVGDPVYDAYLLDELRAAQEVLSRNGALVVWVNLAHYGTLDT
ncbi:MAG: acyltransferase, partial [Actinobacteria bacterium]|nr:acyltransferase [Actinomycetota bacterium]